MSPPRRRVAVGLLVVAWLVAPATVPAADLRPSLVLPSERSNSDAQRRVATPPEAFYEKFRRDAEQMTPERRNDLRKEFAKRRDMARRGGNAGEVQHYERLLGILSGFDRTR